jgi:hypothetical protein
MTSVTPTVLAGKTHVEIRHRLVSATNLDRVVGCLSAVAGLLVTRDFCLLGVLKGFWSTENVLALTTLKLGSVVDALLEEVHVWAGHAFEAVVGSRLGRVVWDWNVAL